MTRTCVLAGGNQEATKIPALHFTPPTHQPTCGGPGCAKGGGAVGVTRAVSE